MMRVARRTHTNHVRARRAMVEEEEEENLEERDPALINLPIPIPTIPIIAPILTLLIGGKTVTTTAVGTTTKTPTTGPGTTPTPTPAPTTTTAPSATTASPGNGGNGGGSGGGSGAASTPGSGEGGGTSAGGEGGGSGSSATDNGNGSSPSPTPNPNEPGSGSGSASASASSPSADSPGAGGSSGNSLSDDVAGATGGSGAASSLPAAQSLAVGNAGSDPSTATGSSGNAGVHVSGSGMVTSTVYSNGIPVATVTSPAGGSGGNGGGSDGGSGSTGTTESGAASKGRHGLSTGAIVGIVIAAIFVAGLLFLFVIRRRSKKTRAARLNRWWQSRAPPSSDGWSRRGNTYDSDSATVRSSFATTFEHGSQALGWEIVAPPVPAMAEIHDEHSPGLVTHGVKHAGERAGSPPLISFHPNVPIETAYDPNDQRRSSLNSNNSLSSDPHSQYLFAQPTCDLFVPTSSSKSTIANSSNENLPPIPISPMSVRPFTPTESFFFPKPPPSEKDSRVSHPSITGWKAPAIPTPPVITVSDPFLTASEVQVHAQAATAASLSRSNSDSSSTTEVETVRRPFYPTLHDELAVDVGDRVRVSRVFDDGWALIEKLPEAPIGKGKAKQVQGLIPLDCFREAGQELPAFLAAKRVSSYVPSPTA